MTITPPPDLSAKIWPIHLKPLEDELLSSWMVRIARAFGIKPTVFWTRLLGPFSFRSVDYDADVALLELLASKTRTPMTRVVQTTVNSFNSFALLWRGQDRNVVAFCPLCLGDGTAYYRRHWYVNFILTCDRHGCALVECCSNCGGLIRLEQVPLGAESLAYCHVCGSDLRGMTSSKGWSERSATLQHRLVTVLEAAQSSEPASR